MYRVFVRRWWKENPEWPNGLEPDGSAYKHEIGVVDSAEEAREACREYNSENLPGRLGRKAEFEKMR